MRPAVLGLLALVSAAACHAPVGPARSAPPLSTKAPVVVALVVDQLSAWVAEERVPELPPDGFFARMMREGTWVKRMRYPYALTDTAPGHASLHTGRTPNETRILVNHNPDEKTGVRRSYYRDPRTKLVTPAGTTEEIGSSAHPLARPTVADALRAKHPKAKIISVSLKDRAALIPAGRSADHALWYDAGADSFVTSTGIEPSFPAWAKPIGDRAAIAKARAVGWDLLDRDWVMAHAGRDDAPGEGDVQGLGTTFPHRVPGPWAFRATPLSDPMLLDLALAGARAERDPKEPLLLLVSLSASDIIGHTFGPSSWEAWDHLRRLDRELARFLRELEALAGPARVLLSADHGNSPMPEARPGCREGEHADRDFDRPCRDGHRILPDRLREELREEATKVLGSPDAIAGVSDGYVFLSRAGRALAPPERAKVDQLVRRVLMEKHEGAVHAIHDVRELAERCPEVLRSGPGIPERARRDLDLLLQVCLSWAPDGGAGDYFVVPAHGSFFDGEIAPDHGASHGTPWLYDRTVPLFVRGPGVTAGATISEPVDFVVYHDLEGAFLDLPGRRTPAVILEAATVH